MEDTCFKTIKPTRNHVDPREVRRIIAEIVASADDFKAASSKKVLGLVSASLNELEEIGANLENAASQEEIEETLEAFHALMTRFVYISQIAWPMENEEDTGFRERYVGEYLNTLR